MSHATPPPLAQRRAAEQSEVVRRAMACVRSIAAWAVRPPKWLASPLADFPALCWALLITLAMYAVMNTWLIGGVQRSYANLTFGDVKLPGTATRNSRQLLKRLELPLRDDLVQDLAGALGNQGTRPATDVLKQLLGQVAGAPGSADVQRAQQAIMRHELSGQVRGLRFFWLGASLPSGERLVKKLEHADPTLAEKLEADKFAQQRKLFVKLTDLLGEEMQPRLRTLLLPNGWVQWFTVLVFWLVFVIAVRRYWVRKSVERNRHDGSAELGATDLARLARGLDAIPAGNRTPRLATLRQTLDGQVYGPLGFLLGALPSLGFIGTVQGMGAALLKANGLFTSTDKQETVSLITQDLGFAFDTTFVALVLSILAGLMIVILRSRELAWLDDWESLVESNPPHDASPSSNGAPLDSNDTTVPAQIAAPVGTEPHQVAAE